MLMFLQAMDAMLDEVEATCVVSTVLDVIKARVEGERACCVNWPASRGVYAIRLAALVAFNFHRGYGKVA